MKHRLGAIPVVLGILLTTIVPALPSRAEIPGVTGTTFTFTAKRGEIFAGDGLTLEIWGYALNDGLAQYPGPTLLLQEDSVITITLINTLEFPVSLVFPGLTGIVTSGGIPGMLTSEAPGGGSVTYSFVANEPGTYSYHSGSNPDLQVEMGLVGALIVRPSLGPTYAYNHIETQFDHEYLFLFTEMDVRFHQLAEFGRIEQIDTTTFWPVYWFLNGRNAPDTMLDAGVPWLPNQPYNCMPRLHPGGKILLRLIGGGRDAHPFHTHANHMYFIAQNGRLLQSAPGQGPDLATKQFTYSTAPGATADALFEWTGAGLGWDIYGHEQDRDNPPTGNFPGSEDVDHNGNGTFDSVMMMPNEDMADHGKPFPVILPEPAQVTYGQHYSGSPFLGVHGELPPGQPHDNMHAGYFYMWHSHNEKEMVNNDIFPGGNMTMLMVEHPDMLIP